MKYVLLICLFTLCTSCSTEESPWPEIMDQSSTLFTGVIKDHDKYEVQILYSRIHKDSEGKSYLRSFPLYMDTTKYFYPASTVKMPVAFLALEKLNELQTEIHPNINKHSQLHIDAQTPPQTKARRDSTSLYGYPTIAHYIAKVFANSDNDAYNRLYEFVGQDRINTRLSDIGVFSNSRIRTRVGIGGFTTETNRYTNPLCLLSPDGDTLYQQQEAYARRTTFPTLQQTAKGKGYYVDSTEQVVMEPFDMSEKNFINLRDLERSLVRIIYPELFPKKEKYNLHQEDYTFLKDMMQRTPREHPYLSNQLDEYYDSYVKFFMYGDKKSAIPDHINIHNKVGYAYGYLTDCAYIQDTKNEIDFFLTATIHVNENQIYNDGKYEYEKIGIPFLGELGRLVYQYELKQKTNE